MGSRRHRQKGALEAWPLHCERPFKPMRVPGSSGQIDSRRAGLAELMATLRQCRFSIGQASGAAERFVRIAPAIFKIRARTEVIVMLRVPSWQVEQTTAVCRLSQEVVMSLPTIYGAKPPNWARMQGTIWRWLCAAYNEISEWRRRSHQREELARMTRYELRDAGINPNDAAYEIGKPFWRA
jgi:uncharacterized protein YjiS (DUF1127 family)